MGNEKIKYVGKGVGLMDVLATVIYTSIYIPDVFCSHKKVLLINYSDSAS